MTDILIKNAVVVDRPDSNLERKTNLYIKDGIIQSISPTLEESITSDVIDVDGRYVSPGLIDMHTHITVPGITKIKGHEFGIDVQKFGVETGVSTIIDAGTFGADTITPAMEFTQDKDTTVLFLLNAAKTGLVPMKPELEPMENIDIEAARSAYKRFGSRIVGIKARASASASGKSGIRAIRKAKKLAYELDLPIVVHIGHEPPLIKDILALLTEGDIITHCFHGKLSNAIVNKDYELREETLAARERGVLFDIGHGSESFNFFVAKNLFKIGFLPDIISTDLYALNSNGPVFSLPATIDKFIKLNNSILPWINMVTTAPRKAFHLSESGELAVGQKADLVVFSTVLTEMKYEDSDGNPIPITKKLKMELLIKGRNRIPIEK
ncbi:MAG: amidohydrolase/deacetylase family metallohydrolase [Chloroflexota bacterium]|nr:amidohydrolase/deacetylase family metallohydrolase [Chloroflexota bacterium]